MKIFEPKDDLNLIIKSIYSEVKEIKQMILENNEDATEKLERLYEMEDKLDNEIKERKEDVKRVYEYKRLIANDLDTRVSILEEESQNYEVN